MKRWRVALVVLIVVGLLMSLPNAATWYARWYLERHYPWMQPRSVLVLSTDRVELRDVSFDRGWVRGRLDEVHVEVRARNVRVLGGSVLVNLDQRPVSTGEEGSGAKVTAIGLTADITRGGVRAKVTGASWDGTSLCFTEADVQHPKVNGKLGDGCYSKATRMFTAKSATTKLDHLPKIPGLTLTEVEVKATTVTFQQEPYFEVSVDRLTAGPVTVEGLQFEKFGSWVARTKSVTVEHPWLDARPVTFNKLGATGTERTFHVFVETDHGPVGASWSGDLHGSETCSNWLLAMPEALKAGPLRDLTWTGELGFRLELSPPRLTLDSKCRATCGKFPEWRKGFTYTAYRADGTPFERRTGPMTSDWVPIALLGKLPMAVINMEDVAFPHHRGFLPEAIQASLTDDVAKGKFYRGGSTITQQAAKNLWLTREKTLGRKVSELFLAQAMESCMSKDEILETYLNIIEFGPDIYGAKAGSQYWFKKDPIELEPAEAFWLASILPAPRKAKAPDDKALDRINRLMATLAEKGSIPDFGAVGSESSEWEVSP